jgi:ribonuclease HI
LLEDGVKVEIMWIPSHVGLEGNEIVDERARHAALNGVVLINKSKKQAIF